MEYLGKEIRELQEKAERKNRLKIRLNNLEKQREELNIKEKKLYSEKCREQKDVEQLEEITLKAVFSYLTGKREEKLDKEKQEAYTAAIKYDAVKQELEAVNADIERIRMELQPLRDCEQEYEKLLEQKAAWVKEKNLSGAEELLEMEQKLVSVEGRKKEVYEAVCAGKEALRSADSILDSLKNAEGWGTWDIVGGGMISDFAKHRHLDEAQRKVEHLQVCLRRFRTELTDVETVMDIQIQINGALQFADVFFDGLFTDWMVLNRIQESRRQVEKAREQISMALTRLKTMEESLEKEQKMLKAGLQEKIMGL